MISEQNLLKMTIEPDVFLVDKILPTGVTLLCGNQKIGKSWLALKLCLCASRGVEFWGYKTLHCKALYCCLEDPYQRILNRYNALLEVAEELQGTTSVDWLHFEKDLPPLNDGLVGKLEQYITENPECKLIIIDTLLMITPPMDDAPYANDYKNIVAFKRFADKHKLAIVLIHHTRKQKARDPFQEIVGTGGLAGAADAMMILSREERTSSKGKLIYTGRDIEDEEISLEFHRGDWRISSTDISEGLEDAEASVLPLMRTITTLVGNQLQWEGTATDFAEASGGAITEKWVTRRLNENRRELEQRGVDFANDRSGYGRNLRITLHGR